MAKIEKTVKNRDGGFTLVELIIVIAILAIIMLIAMLAYGGIQQRMKVRSDKATCGEIGKALAVREADLDKSKGIQLYPEVVEYDSLEDVENYIKPGLTPQSMPDGGYIVTAIQTKTGKKILVGIGKNVQEISNEVYMDKDNAGWGWSEGKEVSEFVTENILSFTPVKTLEGIEGSGVTDLPSIVETSTVAVGSYIKYKGGDYNGDWVVLRNNGGNIEIISKDSVGILTLSGADGYANCVKILNDKCRTYVNSKYAVSGRSVGATSESIEQIDTTQYPITWEASNATGSVLPYHNRDLAYTSYDIKDASVISGRSALKHGTTNTYNNNGRVWLALRCMYTYNDWSDFRVNYIDAEGHRYDGSILLRAYPSGSTNSNSVSCGVRPVITLKSGIRIVGGSGTSDDPYTISL